jgi:hypothetical protein
LECGTPTFTTKVGNLGNYNQGLPMHKVENSAKTTFRLSPGACIIKLFMAVINGFL